jgi:hypothetical protein
LLQLPVGVKILCSLSVLRIGFLLDSTTTTTSSSAASCVLNCKNGGTPETEDGCFCYCLDKTNGRECENGRIIYFFL